MLHIEAWSTLFVPKILLSREVWVVCWSVLILKIPMCIMSSTVRRQHTELPTWDSKGVSKPFIYLYVVFLFIYCGCTFETKMRDWPISHFLFGLPSSKESSNFRYSMGELIIILKIIYCNLFQNFFRFFFLTNKVIFCHVVCWRQMYIRSSLSQVMTGLMWENREAIYPISSYCQWP